MRAPNLEDSDVLEDPHARDAVRVHLRQGYRALLEDVTNKEDLNLSQQEEHDVIMDAIQKVSLAGQPT